MVMFCVDPDQSSSIEKDPFNVYEWIYDRGTLRIRDRNLIYIGPNPTKNKEEK